MRIRKYLIIAVTCVILSGLMTFLIWHDDKKINIENSNKDTSLMVHNRKIEIVRSPEYRDTSLIINHNPKSDPIIIHDGVKVLNPIKTDSKDSAYVIQGLVGHYKVYYKYGYPSDSFTGNLDIERDGNNTISLQGAYNCTNESKDVSFRMKGMDYVESLLQHKADFHAEKCVVNGNIEWKDIAVNGTYIETFNKKEVSYSIKKISLNLITKQIKMATILDEDGQQALFNLKGRYIYWQKSDEN